MKTIITFLIAILAFASTVAWAGETGRHVGPAATGSSPAAAKPPASHKVDPAQRAPAAQRGPQARDARVEPASEFRIELPDAPAVFCACVSQRRLG